MAQNRSVIREAEQLIKAGDLNGGIAAFAGFLRASPNDPRAPTVRARLGELYLSTGRLDEADETLTRALRDTPNAPSPLYRLAQVRSFQSRTQEAFELLDRLLAVAPDHGGGLARRAALLQYTGKTDEAVAVIDDAYARGLESPNLAHAFAGIAQAVGRESEAIDRLMPYIKDTTQPANIRAEMNFTLGRILDRAGDYDAAWARYERGNALTRPRINPEVYEKAIDQVISTYTRPAIENLERIETPAQRAVFIVGMPRSGTTLIEQILGAHPRAAAAGELTALHNATVSIPGTRVGGHLPPFNRIRGNALRRANQTYLSALDAVSTTAERVIDKMPTNFEFLGILPSLLPGARVIHCTRDAMDTCLSCYFRNFVNLHPMFTDLNWIGRYYRCYARLMDHWTRELEGLVDITEAPYERAVHDFEPEARRLVDFVGLEFDDACLRFDEHKRMAPTLEPDQAGKKVYSSSLGRWRNYQNHLGPLIEALGPEYAPEP